MSNKAIRSWDIHKTLMHVLSSVLASALQVKRRSLAILTQEANRQETLSGCVPLKYSGNLNLLCSCTCSSWLCRSLFFSFFSPLATPLHSPGARYKIQLCSIDLQLQICSAVKYNVKAPDSAGCISKLLLRSGLYDDKEQKILSVWSSLGGAWIFQM